MTLALTLQNQADTSPHSGGGEDLVVRAATGELKPERIRLAFGGEARGTDMRAMSTDITTLEGYRPHTGHGLRFAILSPNKLLVKFVSEERWQGYVKDVGDTTFRAVIFDNFSPDRNAGENLDGLRGN